MSVLCRFRELLFYCLLMESGNFFECHELRNGQSSKGNNLNPDPINDLDLLGISLWPPPRRQQQKLKNKSVYFSFWNLAYYTVEEFVLQSRNNSKIWMKINCWKGNNIIHNDKENLCVQDFIESPLSCIASWYHHCMKDRTLTMFTASCFPPMF